MIIWKQKIADRIGELAKTHGKSMHQVCRDAELHPNVIAKLRNHTRKNMDIDEVHRIGQTLGYADLREFLTALLDESTV